MNMIMVVMCLCFVVVMGCVEINLRFNGVVLSLVEFVVVFLLLMSCMFLEFLFGSKCGGLSGGIIIRVFDLEKELE